MFVRERLSRNKHDLHKTLRIRVTYRAFGHERLNIRQSVLVEVPSAITQVDATDERNWLVNHNNLLVVGVQDSFACAVVVHNTVTQKRICIVAHRQQARTSGRFVFAMFASCAVGVQGPNNNWGGERVVVQQNKERQK